MKIVVSLKISLESVPNGPINNIPQLFQIINDLTPVRRQAIIWINDSLVHWSMFA